MARGHDTEETSGRTILPGVLEDLRNLISPEIHTLEQIRVSLKEDEATHPSDIVPLIEKHHFYLRESIAQLLHPKTTEFNKQLQLSRLSHLVYMHGKAEEETLYLQLQRSVAPAARTQGFRGQSEHAIVYQLLRELKALGFDLKWSEEVEGKSRAVTEIIARHLKAEEDVTLPLAQQSFDETELRELAAGYLQRCRSYLALELLTSRASLAERRQSTF